MGFPSLKLAFRKLNAWAQLCPLWLSFRLMEKKRHLQHLSHFQTDIAEGSFSDPLLQVHLTFRHIKLSEVDPQQVVHGWIGQVWTHPYSCLALKWKWEVLPYTPYNLIGRKWPYQACRFCTEENYRELKPLPTVLITLIHQVGATLQKHRVKFWLCCSNGNTSKDLGPEIRSTS